MRWLQADARLSEESAASASAAEVRGARYSGNCRGNDSYPRPLLSGVASTAPYIVYIVCDRHRSRSYAWSACRGEGVVVSVGLMIE